MTDHTELKQLVDRVLTDRRFCGDENHKTLADGVLALIAENERLTKQWGDRPAYRTPEYESKRDAMWRRAHMVATSKGYDHINMAIAAAPSACVDCMGCGGEWQGEGIANSVCETCKGSRGKALEEERDQLRAEIAGLKTGYEAYERVNAELKAESEALRNALRPLLANWDDLKPGESINVDAARAAMARESSHDYRLNRFVAWVLRDDGWWCPGGSGDAVGQQPGSVREGQPDRQIPAVSLGPEDPARDHAPA
jgi:hypothetical protein